MIKRFFASLFKTQESSIDDYLAASVSLVDLERRQKELEFRGFKI